MKPLLAIGLIVVLALTGGCKNEDALDVVPVIEFVAISATEVTNFSNAVSITVRYTDADGDLGSPDPDERTVRVKDARLPGYDEYHLPPLTPDLMPLDISGTFSLQLNPLFILGNGVEETTTFSIQLRDRSGNWSNTITTPQVRITGEE
jgi:hypothetical protein